MCVLVVVVWCSWGKPDESVHFFILMAIGALISLIHVKAYLLCIDFQPLYIFPQIVFLSLRIVNRSKFCHWGIFAENLFSLRVFKWFNLFRCISGNFSEKKNGKIDHVCFILDNRSCVVRRYLWDYHRWKSLPHLQDIWPVWIFITYGSFFLSSPLETFSHLFDHCFRIIENDIP